MSAAFASTLNTKSTKQKLKPRILPSFLSLHVLCCVFHTQSESEEKQKHGTLHSMYVYIKAPLHNVFQSFRNAMWIGGGESGREQGGGEKERRKKSKKKIFFQSHSLWIISHQAREKVFLEYFTLIHKCC